MILRFHAWLIMSVIISRVHCKWLDVLWEEHPYLVSLQSPHYQCVGSLLTKSNSDEKGAILTSARCIDKMNWNETTIGVGCTQLALCPFQTRAIDAIDSYFIHDQYDEVNHNIGLIMLKENVTFGSTQPIPIETEPDHGRSKDNHTAFVTGYTHHFPNILKQSVSNIMIGAECDDAFCVGSNPVAVTDCAVNSGSPIVSMTDGKQIGVIISTETYCNPSRTYAVATYVPFYSDWIASKLTQRRRLASCFDGPGTDADGDGYCGDSFIASFLRDCNDHDPNVYPTAMEQCDGIDNNCNGWVDEGFPTKTLDVDGDGYTECAGDCDDTNPNIHPGATEICDGIDNNCDGTVDEGFDADGDGFTTCAGDCDDTNSAVHPGATEICDGIDNNCNQLVDEGFDLDGDGWSTCLASGGPIDCDDTDPDVHPGIDADDDGYNVCDDCNDNDASINPGATEICDDEIDNDCDGTVDGNYVDDIYIEFEPMGESTQFGIINTIDGSFIKVKMESLTELDSNGKKTKNKVTSFASTEWSWDVDSDGYGQVRHDCFGYCGRCIHNEFTADLSHPLHTPPEDEVRPKLILRTIFAKDVLLVSDIITVPKGGLKLNVEINDWPFLEEYTDHSLELCMRIMTKDENQFTTMEVSEETNTYTITSEHISMENLLEADCETDEGANIVVEVDPTGNGGGNQLFVCYKFTGLSRCASIVYDPIYSFTNTKSEQSALEANADTNPSKQTNQTNHTNGAWGVAAGIIGGFAFIASGVFCYHQVKTKNEQMISLAAVADPMEQDDVIDEGNPDETVTVDIKDPSSTLQN